MSESDVHPELPVDSDGVQVDNAQVATAQVDSEPSAADTPARPQHVQPVLLLLVAVGGFFGALTRYGVSVVAPTSTRGWPTGTFLVNVVGAFLLGVLLEGLARHGPDAGWRRRARLLFGTGFCGALTTYSTLAVETDLLVRADARGLAGAYAVVSVLAGLVATAAGIAVAVGHSRWHGDGWAAS